MKVTLIVDCPLEEFEEVIKTIRFVADGLDTGIINTEIKVENERI